MPALHSSVRQDLAFRLAYYNGRAEGPSPSLPSGPQSNQTLTGQPPLLQLPAGATICSRPGSAAMGAVSGAVAGPAAARDGDPRPPPMLVSCWEAGGSRSSEDDDAENCCGDNYDDSH